MSTLHQEDILFAEDNPSDVELTLRTLSRLGLKQRVRVVRDGKEALDYVFKAGEYAHRSLRTDPKLVLLDLKLPKVTGLEVLQWIRAHSNTKGLPVIILTSSESDRDLVEMFQLGVSGYLVKPLDQDQFCALAGKMVEGLPGSPQCALKRSFPIRRPSPPEFRGPP